MYNILQRQGPRYKSGVWGSIYAECRHSYVCLSNHSHVDVSEEDVEDEGI